MEPTLTADAERWWPSATYAEGISLKQFTSSSISSNFQIVCSTLSSEMKWYNGLVSFTVLTIWLISFESRYAKKTGPVFAFW